MQEHHFHNSLLQVIPGDSRSWVPPKQVDILAGIHLNVTELSIKIFIKYLRSVPNEVIEIKKLQGKLCVNLKGM